MPTIRSNARERARLRPTLAEIAALVGGDDASIHTAILATGATFAEIEQALVLSAGADEALGETAHPLEGPAAEVYEILTADAADEED
jgi:hypothetical protein